MARRPRAPDLGQESVVVGRQDGDPRGSAPEDLRALPPCSPHLRPPAPVPTSPLEAAFKRAPWPHPQRS